MVIEVGLGHLESKKHENEYLQVIQLNLQFCSHRESTSVIFFTSFQNTEKTILFKSVQYLLLIERVYTTVGLPWWCMSMVVQIIIKVGCNGHWNCLPDLGVVILMRDR